MKSLFIFSITSLILSGCVSSVTTYDGTGKKIGKCEAKSAMFFSVRGSAICTGTANGENRH